MVPGRLASFLMWTKKGGTFNAPTVYFFEIDRPLRTPLKKWDPLKPVKCFFLLAQKIQKRVTWKATFFSQPLPGLVVFFQRLNWFVWNDFSDFKIINLDKQKPTHFFPFFSYGRSWPGEVGRALRSHEDWLPLWSTQRTLWLRWGGIPWALRIPPFFRRKKAPQDKYMVGEEMGDHKQIWRHNIVFAICLCLASKHHQKTGASVHYQHFKSLFKGACV